MTPAPRSVIVSVYLPLLSLSLGFVEVAGMWGEAAYAAPTLWKGSVVPRPSWRADLRPSPADWKAERP